MDHDAYTDDYLRSLLSPDQTIAMIGASPKWNRPSYFVMKYLQSQRFRVIPVNPRAAGEELLGETVIASLDEVPDDVDIVDVFRPPAEAEGIVDQAIEKQAKTIWMQIGIRNDEAARKAEAAGLNVVMNRCPKIEYSRLHGELSWGGFNSGVISSRKRRI